MERFTRRGTSARTRRRARDLCGREGQAADRVREVSQASEDWLSPTRRKFLTRAAAVSAVSLIPAALKAGDFEMAIKDEIGPRVDVREPQAANLFLLEDLEDASRTRSLAESDLKALRAVADWTKTFVIKPHRDLGRPGPVCPFTTVALEQKALWLAAEPSAGRSTPEVIQLITGYQRLLLANPPIDGDAASNKSIVVVFTDLPATQAKDFFGAVLEQIGMSSYAKDGLVMGPFYEGNDGTAIYNPNFRPFTSPVPSLLMRRAVISDWKFFLNNEDWFRLWARRYGESAVEALADELRHLPWNVKRG